MKKEKEIILLIESFESFKETIKAIQMVAASDLRDLKGIFLYVVFLVKESEENLEGLRVDCCRKKVDLSFKVSQRRNYSTNTYCRSKRYYVKLPKVPKVEIIRTTPKITPSTMTLEEAKRYLSESKTRLRLARQSIKDISNALYDVPSEEVSNKTVSKSQIVELTNLKFSYVYDDDSSIFLPEPYCYNKNSFEPIYRLLTSKECSRKKLYNREQKKDENWYHRDYWLWARLGEVYYFLLHLACVLKIEKSDFGSYPDKVTDTKVLVLSGPRNSGKSILVNGILSYIDFWHDDVYKSYKVVESKENNIEEFKKKISELEEKEEDGSRYIYIVESEENLRKYYDKNTFFYNGLGEKGDKVYFYHIEGTLEEKGLSKKEIEEGFPFFFFLLINTNAKRESDFWELLGDIWEYSCDDSMMLSEEEVLQYYYDEYEDRELEKKNKMK